MRRIYVPHSQWLDAVSCDLTKPARCSACYLFRLREVARLAKEEGYDLFSTTLLVSPYQDHQGVVDALSMASLEHGIPYIWNDLRRGYLRSRQMARGYHMYMQKYCGCEFSIRGE